MRTVALWTIAAGCLWLGGIAPAVAQEKKSEQTQNKSQGKQSDKQASADKKGKDKKAAEDEFAFTLENIFAEKSYFGPGARSAAFSADGRYAAYLYSPYRERRHGGDLFVYDFKTGKTQRLTSVSKMAEFQQSARKVREDRIAKMKKGESGDKDSDQKKSDSDKKSDGSQTAEKGATKTETVAKTSDAKTADAKGAKKSSDTKIDESGDSVTDQDAEDEKAPRYSGISSFVWHPEQPKILLVSEGDVYELTLDKGALTRLTRTDVSESQVVYLPTGKGFMFSANDVVHQVLFGQHFVEQLNPRLPSGQTLSNFKLSPDGQKMVLVARAGNRQAEGGRTVDIIRYRDRFAKSDSVPRTVSDDEVKPVDTYVYLFDVAQARNEHAKLVELFHSQVDEPRDVISNPEWSLDSSAVTFCFFDQGSSEVQILVGKYPEKIESLSEEKPAEAPPTETPDAAQGRRGGRGAGGGGRSSASSIVKHPARIAYRFQHFGGPNTPGMVSPQFAWDAKTIIFVSEISGFRQLHRLDTVYEAVQQLTTGNFEVYPFQISKDHKTLFVNSTKENPAREMVYRVNLETGEMTQIGSEIGEYSNAAVSDDGSKMLASFVRYGQLSELYAFNNAQPPQVLTDSHPEKARKFTEAKPEFFTYENRHGHTIYGQMFKPKGWSKNKKYPLLIYVYGGPLGTRHSVNDGSYSSDGYFFNSYMSRHHGYVTVVIDPRGQSGYGGLFEKANYEQVGKPQVEDLVDGVNYLVKNAGVDPQKVGIYGWSFGGFQTQMCLYTEPKVFQVGIAGAGPTEWENYNSWYTTGTVGPSRKGETDQKKYSLRPLAKNLEGQLLLIHGMEDTNVLFQDTVNIYRELLQAGKETNVELFLDPTGGHGLGGDVKRLGRYRKYEEFLLRTLGKQGK